MLTYPGTITLPASILDFPADLLHADRQRRRTWRKLSPRDQALLVLVYLRNGGTYPGSPPASASEWPPLTATSAKPSTCSPTSPGP